LTQKKPLIRKGGLISGKSNKQQPAEESIFIDLMRAVIIPQIY